MARPAGSVERRQCWVALGGEPLKVLLTAPTLAKTTHFVLQAARPSSVLQQLPTDVAPVRNESVDNPAIVAPLGLALVVPKRHAKRAVTRNLIKRQMREAIRRHVASWPAGQLLIRQRCVFEARLFPSGASSMLRDTVRRELDQLLNDASAAR